MSQVFVLRTQPFSLPGYPDWMASLLHARGIETPEAAHAFLHPDLSLLHDPLLMHGMQQALQVIQEAQAQGHRAIVYGDYDVDGLCAATIMRHALNHAGLQADIYIPDRHTEGYGVNEDAVRELAQKAQLLITVDCGIGNRAEVELAQALGMRVILTDHHTPPAQLPAADAVVHPMLGEYPFGQLCGAGVAYKMACALMGNDRAQALLDLAALATIADMMPLLDENRVITMFGLQEMARTARPGLRALMEVAGAGRDGEVTADRVGFAIAPRLNAAGRLSTAQDALRLLNTQDETEARALAQDLDAINQERRQVQEHMRHEAEDMLAQQDLSQVRSIVLAGAEWNKGVAGLVAGRLADIHAYPTIVLTREEDLWVGSGRSALDIDLYQALGACADHLHRFGGHRQAAGLALKDSDLAQFKKAFDQAVRAQVGDGALMPRVAYDAQVPLQHVDKDMVRQIQALAPFGMGNPTPQVMCRNVQVQAARPVGNGKHLKMELVSGSAQLDAIYFGVGDPEVLPPMDADVVFEPSINRYNGTETAQAVVRALRAGDQAFAAEPEREIVALLQDFAQASANNESGSLYPPAAVAKDFAAPQGVLLFCRTQQTAQEMHTKYPAFSVLFGGQSAPKAQNALVYARYLTDLQDPYHTVILCDGSVCPGEAALVSTEGARVVALPVTPALRQRLDGMKLTKQDLRTAYIALRSNDRLLTALPLPLEARLAALYILKQLQLIDFPAGKPWLSHMLTMRKCDPAHSPLYRLLNP
ncbi:MAG: single-stranded-DNA-specific exonuclease RecJ [Christensenellales bacterium]